MAKANADLKNLLSATDVYAYELYKELGICCTTYTTKMREELPQKEYTKFRTAILTVAARKAGIIE